MITAMKCFNVGILIDSLWRYTSISSYAIMICTRDNFYTLLTSMGAPVLNENNSKIHSFYSK